MHHKVDLPPPPPLAELAARGRVALFLDFDGTLVEIAETPGGIAVPDRLAQRIEALAARFDNRVALVSGRALADIEAHLGKVAVTTIGSHGAEFGTDNVARFDPSPSTTTAIADLSAAWPRLLIERKPHGVAIHYRGEPQAESAVLSMMDKIATREKMAVRRGKMVVEIGPLRASKGSAVTRLMSRAPFAGAIPFFIGDDITDEGGFAAVAAASGHGILVGEPRPTAAHYRLSDPKEVRQWLNL